MTLKSDAKFEEKLICCFKNDKNLVNFDLSTRNSQNFYFNWFLLTKVYNVWRKKVQRNYLSWYWRVMQNLKKNWSVVSKMIRIWWILTRALKSLKNLHFDWFLLCKVFNVWPKKVQRSYLSWHWRVMENLHHCSVLWKITPLHFFLAQTFILWIKSNFQTFE